jgi:hypothetical protein
MTEHRKRPRDPAQLAKFIVDVATGEVEDRAPAPGEQGKSAKAVERRKLGGQKGARPARWLSRRNSDPRLPDQRHRRAGKSQTDYATSGICSNSSKSMLKLKSI